MLDLQCYLSGFANGKEPTANAGDLRDLGLIPGWGRSPGVENGKPLQHSCLENPMYRGAWWAMGSQGVGHSWSDLAYTHVVDSQFCIWLVFWFQSYLTWEIQGVDQILGSSRNVCPQSVASKRQHSDLSPFGGLKAVISAWVGVSREDELAGFKPRVMLPRS